MNQSSKGATGTLKETEIDFSLVVDSQLKAFRTGVFK